MVASKENFPTKCSIDHIFDKGCDKIVANNNNKLFSEINQYFL